MMKKVFKKFDNLIIFKKRINQQVIKLTNKQGV